MFAVSSSVRGLIGLEQPAPEGDAVGLVDDACRCCARKIVEYGVRAANPYEAAETPLTAVAAEEGQVGHAHALLPFSSMSEMRAERNAGSCRPRRSDFLQVMPVDQIDDLEVPRQQPCRTAPTGQLSSASGSNVWLV